MARCRLAVLLGILGAVFAFSGDVRPQPREGPLAAEIKLLRDQTRIVGIGPGGTEQGADEVV